ncbi:MAG: acetoacetate--CoA ligase [Bacteroidetes bacterium]|nr:MAG: acetoacetate--CoA ligase [Bacteroidota bacterium]
MSNQPTVLWQPSQAFVDGSNLRRYERWLAKEKGLSFATYQEMWQWSTSQIEEFWESIWEYFEVIHHAPYRRVLSDHQMPGARWFEGATLNYAEHLFRHRSDERPALIFCNERGRKRVSWEELEQQVLAVRQFLLRQGIQAGDRVAAYLPNIPEAIICFLAVNSLGAVWSCCSPDFGVKTVIERFSQISPRLFIAVDGYQYNGKAFNRLEEVAHIRREIGSIEQTLFIPYQQEGASLEQAVSWQDMLAFPLEEKRMSFAAVPFEHPIWVLYSSGTTGRPKAITHSHGGVLLEHLKYLAFHNDVHPGEHFFWFTTTGWMMWNFLMASMLMGATPVLYDGSPAYPSLEVLWQLAAELPIHHFGTSAPYLTACMKQQLEPGKHHDFSALRSIGSTGAPLPPEAFEWVYRHVSSQLWLCSMSGGTDVCTAFVGGNPYLPVIKGRIQCRGLGCALYAYDEEGNHIVGSLGEMVIEEPMPCMPIYFWNDPHNERYLSSYFSKYPGKWRHGDWIQLFPDGSLIILGRSDATLNRKGIRIGTAEIYSVLDKLPGIRDSLIINIERPEAGDLMPLFVVLEPGVQLDEALQARIRQALRSQCSPRHVPDVIYAVPDIPYTLSGKKMEVPVKKIFMKMEVSKSLNRDAIRNPEAVDYFVKLAEQMNV